MRVFEYFDSFQNLKHLQLIEILRYDPWNFKVWPSAPPPSPIISGHIKMLNNNSKWDISFSIKCNKAMLILAIQTLLYTILFKGIRVQKFGFLIKSDKSIVNWFWNYFWLSSSRSVNAVSFDPSQTILHNTSNHTCKCNRKTSWEHLEMFEITWAMPVL